jgi:hypothetical protein
MDNDEEVKPKRGRGRPRRNPETKENKVVEHDGGEDMVTEARESGRGADRFGAIVAEAITQKFGKLKKEILQEIREHELKEERERQNLERKFKLYGQAMFMAEEAGDINGALIRDVLDKYVKGARDRRFLGLVGKGQDNESDASGMPQASDSHDEQHGHGHQENKSTSGDDGLEDL